MGVDPGRGDARAGSEGLTVRKIGRWLPAAIAFLFLSACSRPGDAGKAPGATSGPPSGPSDIRLLIVGLDGADWRILDPLLEDGRMPHLARLLKRGSRAKLRSISPMLSPVVWTSVATGVEPTRHGVLDFLVADPNGTGNVPVTSTTRRVPTFWEILSERGTPVGVVGWWASWPASPVEGYIVSDRLAYQLFGYRADPDDATGKTWPPELYGEIRKLIVDPSSVPPEALDPFLGADREAAAAAGERRRLDDFRTLLASGETYLRVAEALRRRFDPQLEAVYFEGTDTIGHLFMAFRPPAQPGQDPDLAERYGPVVDRYYELADRFLGTLMSDRDESWNVMILSDHGFASDRTRPRTTDPRIGHGPAADWHRKFGVLVLAGPAFQAGARIEEATIYDIAPTVLALYGEPVPESWPGKVLRSAFRADFLADHPVTFRADDPKRDADLPGSLVSEDPAAGDLLAKLRALGYVGGDDDAPAAGGSQNNAGVALLGEGRFEQAEAAFRAALEEQPDSPLLRLNLALALRRQGKSDAAREWLLLALDHPQTAKDAADHLAQMELDGGNSREAERLLRAALENEPDAASLVNTLALALEAQGRLEEAEATFEQALGLDPDMALARNNLGNLLKAQGRLGAAESRYREAIEADPYFMGAYNNLALMLQESGRTERAMELYNRALEKAPADPIVLNNLGSLQFDLGRRERAKLSWERSARADDGYASPRNNLASLAILDGDLDGAEELLARALEIDPGYGDARVNLAVVKRARRNWIGAREELLRAVEDPRASATAKRHLGIMELQLGRAAEAIAWLEQSVASRPADAEAWRLLGEAYRRVGRAGDAGEAWRRSLAIDETQPGLLRNLRELERAREGKAPTS